MGYISRKLIAEIQSKQFGDIIINRDHDGCYQATCNGKVVQPAHDAEGIIRYLANILQNT